MSDGVDIAGGSRVGQAALPTPAPSGGPGILVEVAGRRRLGAEGWPAEKLAAAAQLDQIEHLGAMRGINPNEQLV